MQYDKKQNITVYGMKGCNQCWMIKNKLIKQDVEFEYVEDENILLDLSNKTGLTSAPIIKVDEEYLNLSDFAKKFCL